MKMETKSKNKLGWIVGGIWLGIMLIGGGLLFFLAGFSPTEATVADAELPNLENLPTYSPPTATLLPTFTAVPTEVLPTNTPALIPTQTPGPSPTSIAFPTMVPTNDALWEGPLVIGYSVQNRPLEVWRFGRGERKYLVVAGIHGGYEVNTIDLADDGEWVTIEVGADGFITKGAFEQRNLIDTIESFIS